MEFRREWPECGVKANAEWRSILGSERLFLADRCRWPRSPEWRLRFSTAAQAQLWEQDNKTAPRIVIEADVVCWVNVQLPQFIVATACATAR